MAFLTDRTLATGVTFTDLIHIVNTSDTSQNPAGSSYKATIQQVTNLVQSVYITGGTYNSSTGVITFTNSSGGTFSVSGFVTGFTDTSVTAFTYNNNTFTLSESDGSSFSVNVNTMTGLTINGNLSVTGTTSSGTISATTYQNLPTDIRVTGGTFSAGTLTLVNNTGGTFNVIGVGTSTESTTGISTSAITLVTGYSYNGISYSGNVDVTLFSPSGIQGYKLTIKDEGGYASTYRIRITPSSGTIDGNAYVDMNINYMSLSFVARNNNWWII
jgi:hypothetical protein